LALGDATPGIVDSCIFERCSTFEVDEDLLCVNYNRAEQLLIQIFHEAAR
jgi:hypothetical protein